MGYTMPTGAANNRRKTLRPDQSDAALRPRRRADSTIAAEKGSAGPRAGVGYQPTSLKLPLALKARIDETARKAGVSPHAFMLNTLSVATEQALLRERFGHDAQDARAEMKATDLGHELSAVRDYFTRLAEFRTGNGRKPRKPPPKTSG